MLSDYYDRWINDQFLEIMEDAADVVGAVSAYEEVKRAFAEVSSSRYYDVLKLKFQVPDSEDWILAFNDLHADLTDDEQANDICAMPYFGYCAEAFFLRHCVRNMFRPAVWLKDVRLNDYMFYGAEFKDVTKFPRISPKGIVGGNAEIWFGECGYAELDMSGFEGDSRNLLINNVSCLAITCDAENMPYIENCMTVISTAIDA